MTWTRLIVVAGAVWLSGCGGGEEEAARASISEATLFRLTEYELGTHVRGTTMGKGDPQYEELLLYFRDPASAEGRRSLASYVPGLMVECETIQINFLGDGVVVATRASAREGWSQRTRSKTSEDKHIEAALLDRLEATDTIAASGARVDPAWGGDEWTPVRGAIGTKGEFLIWAGCGSREGQFWLSVNLNSVDPNTVGTWHPDEPALVRELRLEQNRLKPALASRTVGSATSDRCGLSDAQFESLRRALQPD